MKLTRAIALLASITALATPWTVTLASAASGEQVAWVRRAAGNFLTAELAGNGAGACAILAAPLRRVLDGRSCAQRWDASLATLLHMRGERSLLRAQLHAVARAAVSVRGDVAHLALAHPLLGSSSRFVWSENCWMLSGG